ncbi:MAG: hypothetical protein KGL92_03375 [Gammaproteobacteria bacterium]|nr:hypothetical protein [Gammaproteobacteria bacterium]
MAARTGVIVPVAGFALPDGLRAGERLDLAAQPRPTRIAIVQLNSNGQQVRPGTQYLFSLHRGTTVEAVPVGSASLDAAASQRVESWLELFESLFGGVIALVVVWRGRDRAAAGLAIFATAFLAGRAITSIPCQGTAGLVAATSSWVLYILARVGFYVMAEAMAGAALNPRSRPWWRAGFLGLLGAGGIIAVGGPLWFVTEGWAGLLQPGFGLVLTASYLVPVALLFVSYRRAGISHRLRLRWMLMSGGVFAVGIALSNTSIPGLLVQANVTEILQVGAWAGFLYAILRHRVVDVRVVVSRTLVYAVTTSLVLGLFALFESLIGRAALGHGASLALELVVPLGLGVSLSAVHRRIDGTVDRLIFRRQYREEVALRRFAGECAFVTRPEMLLDLTVDQIRLYVGAPWVAFYEYTPEGYARVRQRGEQALPRLVATDDLALVKLRAQAEQVDLHESPSGLGRDGNAFPLRARGDLLGVLVVGPRPDEHYAAEERELMAQVAHAVGASLFALRAQHTEALLASARAEVEASAARLDQLLARTQAAEVLVNDARAREAALLDALRALGAAPRY